MIGQLIDSRYKIDEELGAGGMGTVYKGTDTQTGDYVAIKQLKPEINRADILERFKREGEALRELNHPNIVKMLDAIHEDDKHYLIMEYVAGGDLNDLMVKQGTMDYAECVNIAIDLADALTRAHRLDIIHRDLKPENILIGEDGVIRLSDFGVARIGSKERMTKVSGFLGTVHYLSPEALDGEMIDARADIWSFGVVLFEMLSGKHPFEGENVMDVVHNIVTKTDLNLEVLCPHVPVELVDLVYRMLAKDRNARISSVRYVGANLEDILHRHNSNRPPSRFFTLPVDVANRPKHNLPAQITAFIGRERELEELSSLVNNPEIRHVTIVAQGGMGKTRLSLEVARQEIANFVSGVFFVELAPLTSTEGIVSEIAEATGFHFQEDNRSQKQQILDYLANKAMLLVMDNFEHLLDGASIVSDILQVAPMVKVLVTSRQRLNLTGETVYTLSGLEEASVELFIQSAKRIYSDFELTDTVRHICNMVDGMPLAILLAASWLSMLSIDEIADEIERSIEFLENDMSDLPQRHRSIRAVFDYSWNLMDDAERDAFVQLSVFKGGFTREAAQAVTGANLRTLMQLVHKSLIHRDADNGRYSIHDLLRQYAAMRFEQSDEIDAVRDAHMNYYAEATHTYGENCKGRKQIQALDDLAVDFDNIQEAWYRALSRRNFDVIDRMIFGISAFGKIRSRWSEGFELFSAARKYLAPLADEAPHHVYIKILARFNNNANRKEQFELALAVAKERHDLLEAAHCMDVLARLAIADDDMEQSIPLLENSAACYRAAGDKYLLGYELAELGSYYIWAGEIEAALECQEEALNLVRELGDKIILPVLLNGLGATYFAQGKYEDVVQIMSDEAIDAAAEIGNRFVLAVNLMMQGSANYMLGRVSSLPTSIKTALMIGQELNVSMIVGFAQALDAAIAMYRGDYTYAWKQGISSLENVGKHQDRGFFARTLSITACELGNYDEAVPYIVEFVNHALRLKSDAMLTFSVFTPALIYAHNGDHTHAVELMSLASNHPKTIPSHWEGLAVFNRLKEELKAELGEEAFNQAWKQGKSLDIDTVVQELLTEFGDGET